MNPENMVTAIRACCSRMGQKVPETDGQIVRCIFESLAMKYRYTVELLKRVSPHPIEKLHVIGGGSKNTYLCQLTADAIGMPVIAGPAEGTAMGNLLVQAMALGYIESLADIRTHSAQFDRNRNLLAARCRCMGTSISAIPWCDIIRRIINSLCLR